MFFSAFVAIPVFAYALYFLPIAFGVVRGLLSNDPSIMEDLRGDPGIAGVFFVPIVMAVIFLALGGVIPENASGPGNPTDYRPWMVLTFVVTYAILTLISVLKAWYRTTMKS